MSSLTLSVILPTYNCRLLVERSLKDAGSWLDLADEIIVVDSHSTDGTLELISQELHHPQLRVISRDPGLYESWNEAIHCSRGDWIYISTAGDTIKPSHLQHLIESGSRLRADVVVSNARIVADDGSLQTKRVWPACRLIRYLGISSPTVLTPSTTQYFAFAAYPLAILGSAAADVFRGEHLRARPFPLDHGHSGDAAWLLRFAHETRLCLTPHEGTTVCVHDQIGANDPAEYSARLIKELRRVQASGEASDLLQQYVDQELPMVIACRSLQSRLRQRRDQDLPTVPTLIQRAWTKLRLRQLKVRLRFCQSRMRRQIRAAVALACDEEN